MNRGACEKHLINALDAADRLLELVNEPGNGCDHEHCLVLDGVIRDCALQIRKYVADCEGRLFESEHRH